MLHVQFQRSSSDTKRSCLVFAWLLKLICEMQTSVHSGGGALSTMSQETYQRNFRIYEGRIELARQSFLRRVLGRFAF